MTSTDPVLIFDADPARAAAIAELLQKTRSDTVQLDVTIIHDLESFHAPSLMAIRRGRPALAVIVETEASTVAFPGLPEIVRLPGVVALLVLESVGDPSQLPGRVRHYDGWLTLDKLATELPGRVAELVQRSGEQSAKGHHLPVIDSRFLAIVIHDLRTPLNVIGLTIRTIEQTTPERDSELDDDLTMLKENAWQIERMLAQLGDHCRLNDPESLLTAVEFDPRRFLSDYLDSVQSRLGTEAASVRLELADSSPSEVSLDPKRVVMALDNALGNAINAAKGSPVRLRSSGGPDRWTIELIVDRPPHPVVESISLRADVFERLAGSDSERRGLDLAIAARISDLFGGSARLVVEPERRSTIVLDWPDRLALATE